MQRLFSGRSPVRRCFRAYESAAAEVVSMPPLENPVRVRAEQPGLPDPVIYITSMMRIGRDNPMPRNAI